MRSNSSWRSVLAGAMLLAGAGLAPVGSAGAQAPNSRPAGPSAATPEQLYTVLIFERPADLTARMAPAKADAYWTAYDDFAAALLKAGALRGGSALDERVAATVRGVGSADRGVAGARLGGYFVIAAPSLAAAESLARLAPKAAITVELRPHRDNPHAATMAR